MIRQLAIVLAAGGCLAASAQDFKIVWTPVAEVLSRGKDAVPIQAGAKVVRVDVEPAIIPGKVGKQLCVSTLQVSAFGPDGRALAGAPLAISIREDQKVPLQLTHPKGDL